ncbi:MAG: glutamine-hydrolyzing carbamoyl-phosphate synthase small subunit [Armatimonadota bacterium]|nr:glutamine-hydrolyzing carbamoyl-phosphate synthase small subunit [Armatimonadota bacterium]MDR5697259.1 glutamine-hydrolyzing carbamoyl-phosphate synthase small subunit [Armatimonadota bacterium]
MNMQMADAPSGPPTPEEVWRRGWLVLEDGTAFCGRVVGAEGEAAGEVVFTTSMTGYPEVLTDPSYAGQIVVMAFPMIGTYGLDPAWAESRRPFLRGFVVRWASPYTSHWQGSVALGDYLRRWNVVGLSGIDTRKLVRHLRGGGLKRGVMMTGDADPALLAARAAAAPDVGDVDLVAEVTPPGCFVVPGGGPRIAVVDCGLKMGIVRELHARGCEVIVVPATATASEIAALSPEGLVISNGPGDPARLRSIAAEVRSLWGRLPIFGVCLGNQILALAAGARTFKLPFGHRGSNHPVIETEGRRVRITTQNHGYAVDEASLAGTGLSVTHRNLHDGTVEGLRHVALPLFAVQFHPEASPGPRDSRDLFDAFLQMVHSVRAPEPA